MAGCLIRGRRRWSVTYTSPRGLRISGEKTLPVSWLDEKLFLLLPRPGREPTTSRTPRLHNKQGVPHPTCSATGRRIFWTTRKSLLSQTSDVDSSSRWPQSLDFSRMRNCISHAGFGRFWNTKYEKKGHVGRYINPLSWNKKYEKKSCGPLHIRKRLFNHAWLRS